MALFILGAWTLFIAVVVWGATGFGGGIDRVFTADNPTIWFMVVSPIVPLAIWLRIMLANNRGL